MKKLTLTALFLMSLSLPSIAVIKDYNSKSGSYDYRITGGALSTHNFVESDVIYTKNSAHYLEPHNEDHNAWGIAKKVDLIEPFNHEYMGMVRFKNSYHVQTTALTYESGEEIGDNLILGARALLMNGYTKGDDASSNLFITDDISLAAQPFVRYEMDSYSENVGFFAEASMAGTNVPVLSFGFLFD